MKPHLPAIAVSTLIAAGAFQSPEAAPKPSERAEPAASSVIPATEIPEALIETHEIRAANCELVLPELDQAAYTLLDTLQAKLPNRPDILPPDQAQMLAPINMHIANIHNPYRNLFQTVLTELTAVSQARPGITRALNQPAYYPIVCDTHRREGRGFNWDGQPFPEDTFRAWAGFDSANQAHVLQFYKEATRVYLAKSQPAAARGMFLAHESYVDVDQEVELSRHLAQLMNVLTDGHLEKSIQRNQPTAVITAMVAEKLDGKAAEVKESVRMSQAYFGERELAEYVRDRTRQLGATAVEKQSKS